ncbi:unnamed protein product [Nesidiocoris tenuis]|uniref:Uncharacterized protein n=1 Tax=Nesidiocoris tenuis TaxID=355587 RepID=A0A6H5GAD0_9HEMI|nr:unnamed protein product [Nesidiocoris tenuis]
MIMFQARALSTARPSSGRQVANELKNRPCQENLKDTLHKCLRPALILEPMEGDELWKDIVDLIDTDEDKVRSYWPGFKAKTEDYVKTNANFVKFEKPPDSIFQVGPQSPNLWTRGNQIQLPSSSAATFDRDELNANSENNAPQTAPGAGVEPCYSSLEQFRLTGN